MLRQHDVTELFGLGDGHPKYIYLNERMYPVKDALEENWLYYAFAGFKELKNRLKVAPSNFATIGTGNGVDALLAHHVFESLDEFYLTDIDPDVLGLSVMNFYQNANAPVKAFSFSGNHTEPLEKNGISADVIYANLPNIPLTDELQKSGFGLSTFHFFKDEIRAPQTIEKYLLSSQYQFLKTCKNCLKEGASVIIMEGGRFPSKKFDELFNLAGFNLDNLCVGFKPQTEATEVLSGYAFAEKNYKTDFIFYDYEKAFDALSKIGKSNIILGEKKNFLEKELGAFALTASQALEEYKRGKVIGHTCHALRGTLK